MSPAVADAVLSYMASTFEGGDGELMRVASPAATPLSVDRVQVGAGEGGGEQLPTSSVCSLVQSCQQ